MTSPSSPPSLSPKTADSPRPQLTALTGLRFVAAFQIFVFHCTQWRTWGVPTFVRSIAGSGFVAVSLFFLLSGFILTYVHSAPGALDRRDFYANRFARIYPVYAFGLLLAAPFFVGHMLKTEGAARLLFEGGAVATLLQAHIPSVAMAWNPPAWSLSAEAFFYLLFPLVAPVVLSCRRRTAIAIAVGCYVVCVALPLLYVALAPDGLHPATLDDDATWLNALRYGPITRFPEFVAGIVLGRLYLERAVRDAVHRHAIWLSWMATGVLVGALGLAPFIPYPILHNGLLAPAFAALIVALAAGRGPLASALSTRGMVALGEASYSLYILHVPLLMIVHKLTVRFAGESAVGTASYTGILLIVAIAASLLCHRFIEVPCRKIVRAALRGGGTSRLAPQNAPQK